MAIFRRPPQRSSRYGYGRRRPPQRGGFGFWGPFPSYSRRTRGGGQVRVTGCCLPLALTMVLAPAAAARTAYKRFG